MHSSKNLFQGMPFLPFYFYFEYKQFLKSKQ